MFCGPIVMDLCEATSGCLVPRAFKESVWKSLRGISVAPRICAPNTVYEELVDLVCELLENADCPKMLKEIGAHIPQAINSQVDSYVISDFFEQHKREWVERAVQWLKDRNRARCEADNATFYAMVASRVPPKLDEMQREQIADLFGQHDELAALMEACDREEAEKKLMHTKKEKEVAN
eukprot:gene1574-2085_t